MTMAFEKGISFQMGAVDPRPIAPYLLELISSGNVDSQINIAQAPGYLSASVTRMCRRWSFVSEQIGKAVIRG